MNSLFMLKRCSLYNKLFHFKGEHQEVKMYDLLTIEHQKDTFRDFATVSLKSSSPTALTAGECPIDRCMYCTGIAKAALYFHKLKCTF